MKLWTMAWDNGGQIGADIHADEAAAYAARDGLAEGSWGVVQAHDVPAPAVWLFTFDAEGPDGGDYDGLRSVHATKDGALLALFDMIHGLGVDPRDTSATVITSNVEREDGSVFADLETSNGWTVSYGVAREEVKP